MTRREPTLIPVADKISILAPDYINAMPWILRERMTYAQFCAHCGTVGLPRPTEAQWFETFNLTPEEMAELAALRDAADTAPQGLHHFSDYFFVRRFGGKPRVCWREPDGTLGHMTVDDFRTAHRDMRGEVWREGKLVARPLADIWLDDHKTPRFDRVEFLPGKRPWEVPEGTYNLWAGWPEGLERSRDLRPTLLGDIPEPDDEFDDDEEPTECRLFLEHLHEHVCGGDHEQYMWLLGWMADALCNPGPSEVAIIMTGPSGSGKGTFANMLGSLFGPHYFVANREEQISGKHNRHLLETQLLFGDEVDFGGGAGANKRLRNLVTERTIAIEPKFLDAFSAKKWFRIIIATNERHVVGALQDDRRYLVLHVDAGVHNRDRAFFAAIHAEWENGGKVALFRWLTGRSWRRDLAEGQWDVGKRPETAALQEQKILSLSADDQFILGILESGALPGHGPGNKRAPRDTRLSAPLFEVMRQSSPGLRDRSDQRLSAILKDWDCVRWSAGNERGWTFPSLAEMRRNWDARFGKRDWPDESVDWVDAIQPAPGKVPF